MKRILQLCPLLAVLLMVITVLTGPPMLAQTPVGAISGLVADESGAVIPNASVKIRNKGTGVERELLSGADGTFSAPALPAAIYEVRVEVKGFRTVVREATVETGLTTTADIRLPVGQTSEVVNVEAATAQLEYEKHNIDGVITRQQIQDLPLNGRSFMQLASIEPGVTVGSGSTSQYNALFSVSVLGGDSSRTAITVDGGNIRNSIEGGIQMNFSQEVVQEFQLSSANFDLSTGITSVGSINVVTRSGSNQFHGSGYFFFRDHNMAAYPGLARDPANLDPFFARRNPGVYIGGPIKKDKLFFFFNYEYMNQVQAYTIKPDLPSVAGLAQTFGSPYKGKTLSAKFDYRLSAKHTIFARYSHDGNAGFGPSGGTATLPSNWLRNVNFSDQSVLGITSVFTPAIVNDFHFTYGYWHNRNLFPDQSTCPNCLGLDGPQVQFYAPSSNFTVGDTSNATQGRDLRRFPVTDALSWQKGKHRMRFGFEIDHEPGTGFWGYCDPFCAQVVAPEYVASALGPLASVFFPNLPKTIKTNADLLALPFVGAVVGIGDPAQPPPFNIDQAKANNRYRIYGQDTWKITPKFTLNYGLAWEYESTLVNGDLTKPAFLAPLYGSDLRATQNNPHNFSPSLGFAWNVGHDNKTVIRGGAGIYYDSESLSRRLQERSEIGPVGNGRQQISSSTFINTFPGIINLQTQQPVPVGTPVQLALTNMTLGQFEQILAAQGPALAQKLSGNGTDLSVRAIDLSKQGSDLYLLNFPVQRSYQMSIGAQHQLRNDMVVSVDFVRRVFVHTALEPDLNHYNRYINGVQTPVIPKCTAANSATPGAECSNGSITFWYPGGRNVYNAMLVKFDKRFAHRYQFTASYALQDAHGINGIQNQDNYFSSWGPQMSRNVLNVVGIVDLKWGFQLGFVSSFSTKGPIMPSVSGVDLDGDGSSNTPLPGLSYNCVNRGCGKDDIAAAVANFNSTYAGKKDATGKTIAAIVLPANYSLTRNGTSQDLRLTKVFTFKERYKFSVLAEMFNVFNYQNLSGYNYSLSGSSGTSFGIPTQRAGQVFGSGGPRAVQLGGRFTF